MKQQWKMKGSMSMHQEGEMGMSEDYRVELTLDEELDENHIVIQCQSQTLGAKIMSHLNSLNGDRRRLVVKQAEEYVMVQKSEIIFAEVYGKELTLYTQKEELKTSKTLSSLMGELSKEKFVQVSKSSVLNMEMIQRVEPSFSGNLVARMANGMKVSISRRYVPQLKNMLGI